MFLTQSIRMGKGYLIIWFSLNSVREYQSITNRTSEYLYHYGGRLHQQNLLASFIFPQLYKCPIRPENIPVKNDTKSQSNEDLWLYEQIFSTMKPQELLGLSFIEIGALNGLTYSNTWFFEKKFDWRGILIEGHPQNQMLLRINVIGKKLRKNVAVFSAAICPVKGDGELDSVAFTVRGGNLGAALNTSNENYIKTYHGGSQKGVPSACIPLQMIIESTGLLDIDLFSLDVEGAELLVLQTIDFRITNFRVILVELDGTSPAKDEAVRVFLQQRGFNNANDTLGDIRRRCEGGRTKYCTKNEVFLNPNYDKRKSMRKYKKKYFQEGLSSPCL